MNEIEIFQNPDFGKIETIIIENNPYFKAVDVCKCLGYAKSNNAIKRHVHRDDALLRGYVDSLGRKQEMTFINESGLYALVLGSKLKTAKVFQRWVTSEVLPAIRKHGYYELERTISASEAHNRHLLQRVKEAENDANLSKTLLNMGKKLHIKDQVGDMELYSATEVAELLCVTTQVFNKRLSQMGIIIRIWGMDACGEVSRI